MTAEDNALEPVWLDFLPAFIQTKLKDRKNLQKIVANMGWLLFDKVLRMGVGLVVGVWIARYLGPGKFGILNYAVAFVGMFGGFTTLGLDSIVVRELVNRPDAKATILGTSFVLKFAASLISSFLAVVSIHFVKDDALVKIAVAIIAGTMLLQSLDVIRFWFDSQVKSKYVVISQNGAFLVMSVVKVFLLLHKASLIWFVWVILFESILAAIGFVFYYQFVNEKIQKWNFFLPEAKSLLRDSWPLILTGLAIFVYMRISQVMLGSMLGDNEVGIYAAAMRVSEIWYFIPTIVLTSVYPKLVQLYRDNEAQYEKKLLRIMCVFFWFSLAGVLLIIVFSNTIVAMLYGKAYSASAPVLSVHIFTGIMVNMSIIFSHRYILRNQQKISLYGTIIGAAANILLSYLFIPQYGAVGAAAATMVSQFIPTIFVTIFFDRSVGMIFLKSIWSFR